MTGLFDGITQILFLLLIFIFFVPFITLAFFNGIPLFKTKNNITRIILLVICYLIMLFLMFLFVRNFTSTLLSYANILVIYTVVITLAIIIRNYRKMKKNNDKTKIAVNVFNKSAKEYQDKFMEVDLYNDSLDLFCGNITKQNAAILELACGPGNITKYVLQKRPDFKILGTDLAPNMLELAKINNPTAEFQLMDCRGIIKLNQKFDGIICGFALPYLSKEESEKLIADAAKMLNSNGVLYISTMEETEDNKSGFKSSSSGEYRAYVHYHQAHYLLEALQKNNFKITHFQRQDYPATDGTKTVDLLIIAQKQNKKAE